MIVVEEERLREMVGEKDALEAVEVAFAALAEGRVVQPPPMGMEVTEALGEVHVKGAYLWGEPTFAVKVASGFYRNAERGLPTGSGLVLVFDATTGFPLALLGVGLIVHVPLRAEVISVLGLGLAGLGAGTSSVGRFWGPDVSAMLSYDNDMASPYFAVHGYFSHVTAAKSLGTTDASAYWPS